MGHDNLNIKFLATTALEEFWDTSKPILLLGEGCRLYSKTKSYQQYKMDVISSPWQTNDINTAFLYVEQLYENLLSVLTDCLNQIHGEQCSKRYWRIIIGPWLNRYIGVLYDRYMHIKHVIDEKINFTTYVLDEKDYIIPTDYTHYMNLVREDFYNLQVYSKILGELGYHFPVKRMSPKEANIKRNIIKILLNGLLVWLNRNKKIILQSSYLPPAIEARIMLSNSKIGKLFHDNPPLNFSKCADARDYMAQFIRERFNGSNVFEAILRKTLAEDIPLVYLEGYQNLKKRRLLKSKIRPKAILTSISWYSDEVFKIWAAGNAEAGCLLLGTQHGGNYGSLKHHWETQHELKTVDKYYSWGWGLKNEKKISAISAMKFPKKETFIRNNSSKILYVTTGWPRYLVKIPYNVSSFVKYLKWQEQFYQHINSHIKSKIVIRTYSIDYGWNFRARWSDVDPDIKFDDIKISFHRSIKNYQLCICDYLSTTFLEVLSRNIPVLLFWDPADNILFPEAEPYYDDLRKAGILHNNPLSASAALNSIYPDVQNWWFAPHRQDIVQDFCLRFAKTIENPVKAWLEEFDKILTTYNK